MALAIATNNAALNATASASSVNRAMETSMARLSSGKRINAASDDAAGVAISSRLSSEIRGTDQAIRNSLDGRALLDTVEGAHKEVESILQRMREIAVQAANGTNNDQDKANLQAELDAMITEIDRISSTTSWAGKRLMEDENGTSFSFQVGTATGPENQITVNITGMNANSLKVSDTNITVPISSRPGHHNTNDIELGFWESSSSSWIGFVGDTTEGEDSIVEVLGSQYVVAAGTQSEKAENLARQLGISEDDFGTYDADDGTIRGYVTIGEGQALNPDGPLSDYIAAYDASGQFIFFGDPLIAGDGVQQDFIQITPNSDTYEQPLLVSNYDHNGVASALSSMTTIDAAIKTVNTQRSELGAVSNRLNHTVNNLTNISANLSVARGGIEDADFALETTKLAKNQILQQASTAMLAQANASKQNVLSLLQG
jgi:flagellin